jgi:hypothetical protein
MERFSRSRRGNATPNVSAVWIRSPRNASAMRSVRYCLASSFERRPPFHSLTPLLLIHMQRKRIWPLLSVYQ